MSDVRRPTGLSWCNVHNRYEALYEGINEANDPHEPARFDDQGEVVSQRLMTPAVSESSCDCGLYATGYRESWAVRHTASCVYTKARTT